jgi:UDP-GlcNAc:undecaprenyl-phosphate GlcNAc-1-phosphate transferase
MQPYLTERLVGLMACGGVLALVGAMLATPMASRLAVRYGAVAVPRDRDLHDHPVPRWGGLAIFAGFLVSVGAVTVCCQLLLSHAQIAPHTWIQGGGIVLGGLVISIVGAVDDLRELSPVPRLLGQIAASLIAFAAGVRVDLLAVPFTGHYVNTHILSVPITLFWMLLLMNAINWLDGLDGLAAGVCCIISTFLAVVALVSHQVCLALLCVALAGSTIGFLRFNYTPARIYMGGGAEFLGFVLAAVSIVGAFKQVTTVAILIPLIAMGVPIFDSVHVVLRRAASGEPVYQADRRHFHHLLVDMGLSKEKAVLVLYAITAALCLCAWTLLSQAPPQPSHTRHTSTSVSKSQLTKAPIRAPTN